MSPICLEKLDKPYISGVSETAPIMFQTNKFTRGFEKYISSSSYRITLKALLLLQVKVIIWVLEYTNIERNKTTDSLIKDTDLTINLTRTAFDIY